METIQVVAVISGGCLQDVYASAPIDFTLIDVDNLGSEGKPSKEIDKIIKKATKTLTEMEIGGPV